MKTNQLTTYLNRAHMSRRELSRMTGIAHSTLDDIFHHPQTARGHQMREIAEALGLTNTEVGELITGKEERR